ncbi:MAG TPA: tetratricopeptide repeat protein [Verrucomicrobiae bacterium]|nr:tetratricopeptide repeat protein [Verrucomicrobiae bacterium]
MKQILLLCALVALGSFGITRVWAAVDPGDQFLEAYFLIQDGDAAEHAGDWEKAITKYSAALDLLRQIKADSPDWNPHIIDFRTKYCGDHLDTLRSKAAAAAPAPAPAVSEAPPAAAPTGPEAPAAEPDAIQRLNTELQQARDTIRQLQQTRDELSAKLEAKLSEAAPSERAEAEQAIEQLRVLQAAHEAVKAQLDEAVAKAAKADELTAQLQQSQEKIHTLEVERNDLNTKLQTALAQIAPTQSNPQIEDLMKENADLTAKLATARSEIDDLRGKLSTAPPATDAEKIQLRADLTQTKQQLESAQAENVQLKSSQQEIMARLTESDRQLRAAKASNEKSDEIIEQLRKENAVLKEIVNRKGFASAEEEESDTTEPSIPELKGWHPRRRTTAERPPVTPRPAPPESASAVKESGAGKLVATIKAPIPAGTTNTPPAKIPPKSPAPAPAPPPTKVPPKINTNATAHAVVPASPAVPSPPSVNVLLNEARAAFVLKDFDTAETKYQAVLAQDPTNMTALSNIGVICYKQGKLDEAEQTLRKVVAAAPNDSQSRSLLGAIYYRSGKLEEAFGELTRAVALDPRNAEAHNYLGITLSKKGWQAAAEQEIRRALELNPQYADAHFNLAAMYARQKTPNLELARYHYQKALDLGAERDPQMEALLKAPPSKPEDSNASESHSTSPTASP